MCYVLPGLPSQHQGPAPSSSYHLSPTHSVVNLPSASQGMASLSYNQSSLPASTSCKIKTTPPMTSPTSEFPQPWHRYGENAATPRAPLSAQGAALLPSGESRYQYVKPRRFRSRAKGPPRDLHVCKTCSRTFLSPSGLRRHEQRVHLQEWKYKCDICHKTFVFREHFQGHLNSHSNIKAFKCPDCPKRFTYKSGVSLHRRNGSCTGSGSAMPNVANNS